MQVNWTKLHREARLEQQICPATIFGETINKSTNRNDAYRLSTLQLPVVLRFFTDSCPLIDCYISNAVCPSVYRR